MAGWKCPECGFNDFYCLHSGHCPYLGTGEHDEMAPTYLHAVKERSGTVVLGPDNLDEFERYWRP